MDVSTVQRRWPDIVEAVKLKSRATWMVIMSGVRPVSLEGKVLTLSFDAEGARLGFVNGNRDMVLRDVLQDRMNVDWRIETVVGGAGGPAGGGRPRGGGPGAGGGRPGPGGAGTPGPGSGSSPSSGFGSASNSGTSGFGGGSGFGSASAPAPSASQPSAPSAPSVPSGMPSGQESRATQSFGANPSRGTAVATDLGPLPPPPDEPPPPLEPVPVDESDEVDPEGDADADGLEAQMSGMTLIQRELGGQIIREIDGS